MVLFACQEKVCEKKSFGKFVIMKINKGDEVYGNL